LASAQPEASRARGHLWKTVLGLALSALFLYWALKDVDAREVLLAVRRADPFLFALSVFVVTLTFPARAVRWRIMLGASTREVPPWAPVWHATAIGFMANNVLPARAGEVARAYAGSQLVGLPVSTALGTIAVERVFDGVAVVLLFALGIGAPEFPAEVRLGRTSITGIAWTMGLTFGGLLVFLAAATRMGPTLFRMVDGGAHRLLPARAAEWSTRVARNLFEGLSSLRTARTFARVLTWAFVVWVLNAASYYMAFLAFRLGDLPLSSALVLQGIAVLAVTIPSSPGYLGVFEAACIAGLGIYGVEKDTALGFAVALHMGWFIPITVLGFWSLGRAGFRLGELGGRSAPGTLPNRARA